MSEKLDIRGKRPAKHSPSNDDIFRRINEVDAELKKIDENVIHLIEGVNAVVNALGSIGDPTAKLDLIEAEQRKSAETIALLDTNIMKILDQNQKLDSIAVEQTKTAEAIIGLKTTVEAVKTDSAKIGDLSGKLDSIGTEQNETAQAITGLTGTVDQILVFVTPTPVPIPFPSEVKVFKDTCAATVKEIESYIKRTNPKGHCLAAADKLKKDAKDYMETPDEKLFAKGKDWLQKQAEALTLRVKVVMKATGSPEAQEKLPLAVTEKLTA